MSVLRGLMVRPEGLEPPAYRFEACRSIQLSYGRTEVADILSRLSFAARAGGWRAGSGTQPIAMLESVFPSA